MKVWWVSLQCHNVKKDVHNRNTLAGHCPCHYTESRVDVATHKTIPLFKAVKSSCGGCHYKLYVPHGLLPTSPQQHFSQVEWGGRPQSGWRASTPLLGACFFQLECGGTYAGVVVGVVRLQNKMCATQIHKRHCHCHFTKRRRCSEMNKHSFLPSFQASYGGSQKHTGTPLSVHKLHYKICFTAMYI